MFKLINHHWQKRRERFYSKNRWHLILDYLLGIVIIVLTSIVAGLFLFHPQLKQPLNLIVQEKPDLDLNNLPLVINFSLASSTIDMLNGAELRINIKNSNSLSINNIKVDLSAIDKNFTIVKLENINKLNDVEINNHQIIISSMNPSEERTAVIKIIFESKDQSQRVIKWQSQNEYSIRGQIIREVSSLPDIFLAAELKAMAVVYYHSPQGDQLGSGPLPPRVNLPTNYWAFFDVKSVGDFKNLVFSAKLPKGIELTDRRSLLSGDFKYNKSSRQIIWTIAYLKNQNDGYRIGVEIQLIPDTKQLGGIAPLLTDIKYYAVDSLTENEVSGELPVLTTSLDFDRLNRGQGEISLP